MRTIDILVAVDCVGALASGSLKDNAYIVDTNGYEGSWNEGTSQLVTICQDGQRLSWGIQSVNPGNQIDIVSFGGQMVTSNICNPSKQGIEGAESWKGQVQTRGSIGQYNYTIQISIDGASMSFDAYIKVA
jgi:threonine dehydrogenase-like Zn-dependent dehydrogenase